MTTIKKKLMKRSESKNPIIVKRREYLLERIKELSNTYVFPEVVNVDVGFSLINQYKLSEILDKPLSNPFQCIISKHKYEDKESAQLIEYKGKEYYVCKYCISGDYMSVSDALCRIMGLGPLKMQLAVFNKLGLEITSSHKENKKNIIKQNLSLLDEVMNGSEYPFLLKSNLLNLYLSILKYSSVKLPLKPLIESDIIISIPLSSLSNHLKSEKLTGVDKGTLSRKTNLLTLLGLLRKEHIDNLPEYVKKESSTRKLEHPRGKYYDKTYWSIPTLTAEHLLHAEAMLRLLKTQHITMKDLTAAKFKFLLGIDLAKELFPAKEFYHYGTDDVLIEFMALEIIKKKGWLLSNEFDGSTISEKIISISIDKMLYNKTIKKVKVSNEIRNKYNIPTSIHTNCMILVDYTCA